MELRIEVLLQEIVNQKASDLHLQVGLPPMMRIDGSLVPVSDAPVLDTATTERLVFSVLDQQQQQILIKDKEIDLSFTFGEVGRFRVNAFHERGNIAAALRLIPNSIPSIAELGLPPIIETFADFPRGLVLVTGPTGVGKSTTLAALIDKIANEKAGHVITIEDPIEFTYRSKRSVIAQREIHYDTYSFSTALRSVVRQDPDVVLIGEMRDLETTAAAIEIAETGHLVLATLHTNSAAQSIDRIINIFPAGQKDQIKIQLANVIQAICSQRLVPAIGGGRIAAAEVLIANSAVRNIIREGRTHQLDTVIQTSTEEGMQSMDHTLAELVRSGKITFDDARNYAVDVAELEKIMRG